VLMKRDEGGVRSLDDLAMGLDAGAISRGKAIKLAGAAVAASAFGLFASRGADAQVETAAGRRRRCLRRGGDFCNSHGSSTCCAPGRRRGRACCGKRGASCCTGNQRCDQGRCRRR
jgi:hypothetical protein